MTGIRRLAAAIALALAAALALPGAAQAAGFQFWGFYQLADGDWGFAAEGAGTTVPDDGSVEGWRFAVSSDDEVRVPRAVLDFEQICGQTGEQDGMKRIGVVIDPGRDVDAPEGSTPPEPGAHCVLAEEGATSQEVLTQVADVRTDAGMVCGLDGFPADGCAEEVADPTEEQLAPDEPVDIPVAAPADPAPTEGDDATDDEGTGDATEDEGTEDDATDGNNGTEDNGTDGNNGTEDNETGNNGTEDNGTDGNNGTEDNETGNNGTEDNGTDDTTVNQDEATDDGGLPGWVWLVGVVLLVGILLALSAAARNRRLEQAGAVTGNDPYDPEGTDDPEDPTAEDWRRGPRDD